jgi:uncharacterized membrane protein
MSKRVLLIVNLGLVVWLVGIVVTPMLAASGLPLGQKFSAFMYFFYQPVCHQITERSFWLDGFTLAVCVRCFSFYLGGFVITLIYLFKNSPRLWKISNYVLFVAPVFIDFLSEKLGFYTNFVILRLLTGFLLGIAFFQLLIVSLSTSTGSTEKNAESLRFHAKRKEQSA